MTCPGCSTTYIGKTERHLQTRLAEHTNPTKSAIGQHFHNCEHVQYIVNLQFAFDKLNNPTDADNKVSTFISNLIIDNSRILHTIYSRTSNFLLLLEAPLMEQLLSSQLTELRIKSRHRQLLCGRMGYGGEVLLLE